MNPMIFDRQQILIKDCTTIGRNVTDEEFLNIAEEYAMQPYGTVLLSGTELDCSRYSLAAGKVFCVLESKNNTITLTTPDSQESWHDDPLAALDLMFARLTPDFSLLVPPFSGGAIGYFAYELKNHIETLPQNAVDDLTLPDMFMVFPSEIIVHDRRKAVINRLVTTTPFGNAAITLPTIQQRSAHSVDSLAVGPLKSNFTRNHYCAAVRRIRDYIRAGDVYQVNLSQRFSFDLQGQPWQLFRKLFALNPAPFYAFINGGNHQIVSTSMERFLFRNQHYIETRPIKGTRPRGATEEENIRLRDELLSSEKDGAELSMIVDLLRNDLGKVCEPKTVRVTEHKRLETYQNVFHLISIVSGRLRQGISHGDLLRATFPGGSITGCPKIRAMEIIDELEPQVRHVYTGSIGYLGWHDNVDLNIAIRTAIVANERCHFAAGGGVVYDSGEQEEYEETLHKAQTLLRVIESLGNQ